MLLFSAKNRNAIFAIFTVKNETGEFDQFLILILYYIIS